MVPLIDPVSNCAAAGQTARSMVNRAVHAAKRRLMSPGWNNDRRSLRMHGGAGCVITALQKVQTLDSSHRVHRGLKLGTLECRGNRLLVTPSSVLPSVLPSIAFPGRKRNRSRDAVP